MNKDQLMEIGYWPLTIGVFAFILIYMVLSLWIKPSDLVGFTAIILFISVIFLISFRLGKSTN